MSDNSINTISSVTVCRKLLAFTAGFIWSVNKKRDFVEFPISSIALGSFSALGAMWVSDLVAGMVPPITDYLLIATLSASCYHYGNKLVNSTG